MKEEKKLIQCSIILIFTLLHILTLICCSYLIAELVDVRRELSKCFNNEEFDVPVSPAVHQSELDKTIGFFNTSEVWTKTNTAAQKNHDDARINEIPVRLKRQANSTCGDTTYIEFTQPGPYNIQSPGYPNNYSNNLHCEWYFVLEFPSVNGYQGSYGAISGFSLRISFPDRINLESDTNCAYDYLEIRGGSRYGPLLGKFCGINTTVPSFDFSGPLHVTFKSDISVTNKGFRAQVSLPPYSAVSPIESSTDPRDITYVRWGKKSCRAGRSFYDGYAVGFANSTTQSLKCIPFPLGLRFTDRNLDNFPTLIPARFKLQGETTAFRRNVNEKLIQCALCHARRSEVFTIIGWKSCNDGSEWDTLYTGYTMTVWSTVGFTYSQTSETICMDSNPDVSEGYGTEPLAPEVTFVKSGTGLWLYNKIMPCAVCIRQ